MRISTAMQRPEYSAGFRCIGAACEDSCCAGWNVTFDERTCGKYDQIPDGPLRVLLDEHVVRLPANADGTAARQFAKVRLDAENACPFLNAEKLCRIQSQYGEGYLSATCATYPRVVHGIDGLEEKTLSLSCPEAARLVLLNEDLLAPVGKQYQQSWDVPEQAAVRLRADTSMAGEAEREALKAFFWPIRGLVLRIIKNRRYLFWQRLFLLGVLARQLDAFSGEGGRQEGRATQSAALRLQKMIAGFEAAIDSRRDEGGLRPKMDVILPDLPLQLALVLQMAGLGLPGRMLSQRFQTTIAWFTKGIGRTPEATIEALTERYAEAYAGFYEPFFLEHGYVLENLMINAVFRNLFPYGKGIGIGDWRPAMEREFTLLAAHFALLKGLLIGVAGFHGSAFSEEHLIHTVQTASKQFEHHPTFLEQAHGLLVHHGVDDLRGITMLLRN